MPVCDNEPCVDLQLEAPSGVPALEFQQNLVLRWARDHLSRCSHEFFLEGLNRAGPAGFPQSPGAFEPVLFDKALFQAILNEAVIEVLSLQLGRVKNHSDAS